MQVLITFFTGLVPMVYLHLKNFLFDFKRILFHLSAYFSLYQISNARTSFFRAVCLPLYSSDLSLFIAAEKFIRQIGRFKTISHYQQLVFLQQSRKIAPTVGGGGEETVRNTKRCNAGVKVKSVIIKNLFGPHCQILKVKNE